MPVIRSKRRILPLIIGTAGHVDHGKTALVKNLTGCETDTLPEEKRRQLSINLGFAPLVVSSGCMAGIVDVPGHEDFIRNMVAGAVSMDVVILTVAANDGIMPQTIEHTQIVRLLGIPRIVAVITKMDMVDETGLNRVKEEVGAFLGRMGYPDTPVVSVSNQTFHGLSDLRQTLDLLAENAEPRKPSQRAFRMNVERVFGVKGQGTVVTGIPVTGLISAGDPIELLPGGGQARVRSIQSYKQDARSVEAHVCGALLLKDVEVAQVRRGMTVAACGAYQAVVSVVATIENASGETLGRAFDAKLHCGTSAVMARVRMIDPEKLPMGETGFAHLRLMEPVVMAAGDRFIVRGLSHRGTLGGGIVLCTEPDIPYKTGSQGLVDRLKAALRALESQDHLRSQWLAGSSPILTEVELPRLGQLAPDQLKGVLSKNLERGQVVDLGAGGWLLRSRSEEIVSSVKSRLNRYHMEHPNLGGMDPGLVCQHLGLEAKSSDPLVSLLCQDPEIVEVDGLIRLASFSPRLSRRREQMLHAILERIRMAGVKAPARGDLMRDLDISEQDMQAITKVLVEERTIRFIDTNLVLTTLFEDLRHRLLALFSSSETVDIATFCRATGLGRKLAQGVLETFDAEGMTKRSGPGRVLLK